MLTRTLAEQRRAQGFREGETRADRRKKKPDRPTAILAHRRESTPAKNGAPAYLQPAAPAVMMYEPLDIAAVPLSLVEANPLLATQLEEFRAQTDELTPGGSRPTRLAPAYCAIPDESASLYSRIDRQLTEESDRTPGRKPPGDSEGKQQKPVPREAEAPDTADEGEKAEAAGEGKEAGKEGMQPSGADEAVNTEDKPADKEEAGKTKGRKRRTQRLRKVGEEDTLAPRLAEIPRPETEMVALRREPPLHAESAPGFTTPEAPVFTVPAGAKPEPPTREQQLALVQFKEAMIAARRLYEELVADSAAVAAQVQATTDRLAALRQRDLDQAVEKLGRGLMDTRARLDERADAALQLVERKARRTRAIIWGAAGYAFGELAGAKGDAEGTYKEHDGNKEKAKKDGDTNVASVEKAGKAASDAVLNLEKTKEKDNPTNVAPMKSAQNEKINMHLAQTTVPRAKTYSDESTAEADSLRGTYKAMGEALDKQFAEVVKEMTKTAKDSDASIAKARNGALKQLKSSIEQLRNFIAEARASGHAALVQQHNLSRRQLIVSYRERARMESQSAQQRLARGTSSTLALATGQQTGARALADTLGREKARPPAEFAKVIASSASAFIRNVGRTRGDQRARVARSAEAAEVPPIRQADATSARSAASAGEIVNRLHGACDSSVTAMETQTEKQLEPLPKIPNVIFETLAGTLKSARAAYDSQNKFAGDNVKLANDTLTNAMSGKGGNGGGDNAKAAAKPPEAKKDGPVAQEIPNDFIARAEGIAGNATTDVGVSSYLGTARETIREKVVGKSGRLKTALTAFSTPIEPVMAELRAITALQGVAITDFYNTTFDRNLVRDLRVELRKTFSANSTNNYNISAALNYLAGNHKAGALQEMKAAVNYSNDEGRVERVQRQLTPTELEELNREHPGEMEDIVSDLGGNEEKAARALNTIKGEQKGETPEQRKAREQTNIEALGLANAFGLQVEIDRSREKKGEAGGDAASEMLATKYQSIGSDVLSGGDPMGAAFEDPVASEERRAKLWKATGKSFDEVVKTLPDGTPNVPKPGEKAGLSGIARYAAAARKYTEYVPDDSPNGFHTEIRTVGLNQHQTELIDAIVKHGPESEDAAAATVMVELNRASGKPKEDKLRKALGSDMLAAREGESDKAREARLKDVVDKDGKIIRKGDLTLAKERRENILRKIGQLDASAKAAEQPGGEGAKGPPPQPKQPEAVKAQILQTLDARLAFDPTARAYTRSMVEGLEPDPVAAFDFALAHEEKNKETLLATTGRMNRDQIDEAVAKWDAKYPQEPPLYKKLGMFEHGSGALEGDARNEVEIKFMGVPRNDRERAEVANMATKQTVRDSGAGGRAIAHEEYQRMLNNQSKLLKMMGVKTEDIDAMGRIRKHDRFGRPIKANFDEQGRLVVKNEEQREEFATLMQLSSVLSEDYKATVDKIAMGITMALMVIAAVVTTFITAGGAAAIWGPILVTAGAGLIGIGVTAALKGDRYTSAELQRDLVMTFVQAATAGLGAYAGAALKGGGAAAKAAATMPKVAETAAKPSLSLGMKALNLGKEVVIDSAVGGTTNAINSAAGAYMDPENRRLGKSGEKAAEGGFKSFIGGAVGSALTKPIGNLGKMKGGALGERVAGNVASGFTTRLTEARVGQAMGDPHQSWAESLEVAKEGLGQDIIQAGGEHGAHRAGERRAARKVVARMAREPVAAPPRPVAAAEAAPHPTPVRAPAQPDAPTARAIPREAILPPPPPKPAGPQHTPESMARAAAIRESLPPDARAVVDQAVPVKPPAPDPSTATGIPPDKVVELPRPPPRPPAAAEAPAPRSPDAAPRRRDGEAPESARRGVEEAAATRKAGVPEESEAPARRPTRPEADEPAILRSPAGAPDGEPRLRTAFDDDPEKTDPQIRIGPPPPAFPKGIDLKPGTLETLPDILPETVVRPVNPKDGVQAQQNYDLLRTYRPGLEVLLAYNPSTGEYMPKQGFPGKVIPPPEGWITLRHSHGKVDSPDPIRQLTAVLPSGIGEDITVLRKELDREPGAGTKVEVRRSSVIDIEVNGSHVQTTFEITRTGDNYSLTVTVKPPMQGVSTLGPFTGDRDMFVRQYAYAARDLVGGTNDFGLTPRESQGDVLKTAAVEPSSRVVRGASLTEAEVHDAQFVARRMAQAQAFDQQARSAVARGEFDPVIARAATTADAHGRVRAMGLVGEPDSLQRLTRLLNSSDPAFTPEMRSAVARATLEATRAELTRNGGLAPGDELMMLFRGVTGARTGDYAREGMDLARLGPGGDEDAGRGLYGSQDFESARHYTGSDGQGVVLPLIVRRSELGNVIDVRSGTPLGDRWLAYIRASAREGRIVPDYQHLRGVLDPRFDLPIGLGRGGRGDRFQAFLATLAADPTLPPPVREAARDPHITLMDLGGVASWGNDRTMLTDQFAMHHQRIADLFNDAYGFPRPRSGDPEGPLMLRSALTPPEGGTKDPVQAAARAAEPKAAKAKATRKSLELAAHEPGVGETLPSAAKVAEKPPTPAERAQGKRVLSMEEARRAREAEAREQQRADELESKIGAEEARRAGASAEGLQLKGHEPPATAHARKIIAEVEEQWPLTPGRKEEQQAKRIDDMAERLDQLLDRIENDADLAPETRRYLKWKEQMWRFQLEQSEASRTVTRQGKEIPATVQQHREAVEVAVPKASAEAREANSSIKKLMEKRGPNYRSKKARAEIDEVMDPARAKAVREAELAGAIPKTPLSPDHLVALTRIANLPELAPLFEIFPTLPKHLQKELIRELVGLGDIDENLVPMSSFVNSAIKSGRPWSQVKYHEVSKYYSEPEYNAIVAREAKMLQDIKTQIAVMVGRYLANTSRIQNPEIWIGRYGSLFSTAEMKALLEEYRQQRAGKKK